MQGVLALMTHMMVVLCSADCHCELCGRPASDFACKHWDKTRPVYPFLPPLPLLLTRAFHSSLCLTCLALPRLPVVYLCSNLQEEVIYPRSDLQEHVGSVMSIQPMAILQQQGLVAVKVDPAVDTARLSSSTERPRPVVNDRRHRSWYRLYKVRLFKVCTVQ